MTAIANFRMAISFVSGRATMFPRSPASYSLSANTHRSTDSTSRPGTHIAQRDDAIYGASVMDSPAARGTVAPARGLAGDAVPPSPAMDRPAAGRAAAAAGSRSTQASRIGSQRCRTSAIARRAAAVSLPHIAPWRQKSLIVTMPGIVTQIGDWQIVTHLGVGQVCNRRGFGDASRATPYNPQPHPPRSRPRCSSCAQQPEALLTP